MHNNIYLNVVDGRERNWLDETIAIADKKLNFVLLLNHPGDINQICDEFGCVKTPEKLERWGLHALADVLKPDDYSRLLHSYEKYDIRLIEQLGLGRNIPPRVKPFILYCEIRGIISEHTTLEDAGNSLLDYLDYFKRARLFPLAGIYKYSGLKWDRVKKLG